jgi:hypothetical protein
MRFQIIKVFENLIKYGAKIAKKHIADLSGPII